MFICICVCIHSFIILCYISPHEYLPLLIFALQMKKMIKDFNMSTICPKSNLACTPVSDPDSSTRANHPDYTGSSVGGGGGGSLCASTADHSPTRHPRNRPYDDDDDLATSIGKSTSTTAAPSSSSATNADVHNSLATMASTPDDCLIHSAVDDILSATLNTSSHGQHRQFATPTTANTTTSSLSSCSPSLKHRSLADIAATIGKRKSTTTSSLSFAFQSHLSLIIIFYVILIFKSITRTQ